MMINEFEKLTGTYPTADLYAAIEAAYYEFDGDKVAFCKAYTANADGLAEQIRDSVNAAAITAEREHAAELTRKDIQIDALTKTYDLLKDMEDQARGLKNEFAAGLASVDISPLQDSMDSLHAIVTDPEFQQGMTDLAAMVLKITGAAAQGIARLPADVQSLINQYQVLKASAFGSDKDRHLAGVAKQQELVDNLAAYNNASGPMGKFATDPSLYVGDALLNKDWKAAQRDADLGIA